jgi:hypothetical protein
MPRDIVKGLSERVSQAACGAQDFLILAIVPAAASQALVGEPLVGKTLTATGVYRCLIPISGLASNLQVYLNATWTGGTVVSDVDTLFTMSAFPTIPAKKGATVTGDGSLTTATLQTVETTALNGEQYAIVDLTLSGTTSVVFTVAEFNGK